jgi:MarC family membrane protein
MNRSFLSVTILLVLITDPLGNIPLFISSLKNVPQARRPLVILRECLIAFLVLVGFLFFGNVFLSALGLSDDILRISGGVILFLIALNMIFPGTGGKLVEDEIEGEPFIVPVAIPLIAGPSAITYVMLLMKSDPSRGLEWVGAIFIAILVTMVAFFTSTKLEEWLGPRALSAIERVMGLVLTAISIEMLLEGLSQYLARQ